MRPGLLSFCFGGKCPSNKTILRLVACSIFCSAFTFSYDGNPASDSLFSFSKNEPDDTFQVRTLAEEANKLASSNPKEAVKLARHIVALSVKFNYAEGKAIGYNELGHAFERHSINDSAFYYFFLSAAIFSQLNNLEGRATSLYYIGDLHEITGRLDSAAFYLFQSLQLSDSIDNPNLKAKNHRVIGNMLTKQNRLDEALEYYFSALRLFKIQNNLPELIARVQENIALVYIKKENYKDAETYFSNALNIYTSINEERGLARLNLNIASLRQAQGRYEEALSRLFYALGFYEKIEHPNGIAESLLTLSQLYLKMEDYDNAIKYNSQTLAVVQQNAYRNIELEVYRIFQKIYFIKGNYKEAYHYLNKASVLHDSLFSENKESIISELQAKYNTEKKEKEIQLLNKDNEIKSIAIKRQEVFRSSLIGGTILIVVIGLLLFNRYRNSQKQNRQAERLRLSSDLHDEMGSTLSSIGMYSAYAGQQLSENKTGEAKKILEEISTSSWEMIDDMNDIIWAINPRNDSFEHIINRLRNYASRMAQTKNIILDFRNSDSLHDVVLSMEQRKNVFLICKEAINNAVKYSGCKTLSVHLHKNKKHFSAEIRDDGEGFDTNSRYDGNGLKNMKQRAEQIGTNISIQSTGSGTKINLEMKLV